jgi:hypothetical protein
MKLTPQFIGSIMDLLRDNHEQSYIVAMALSVLEDLPADRILEQFGSYGFTLLQKNSEKPIDRIHHSDV